MVEPIKPTETPQGGATPQTLMDEVIQLELINSQVRSLEQVQKATQQALADQLYDNKNDKRPIYAKQAALDEAMEPRKGMVGAQQAAGSSGKALDESSDLPPSLQQAYELMMKDMKQFLQMLLKYDPKDKSLIMMYAGMISQMSVPPTSADASQLNLIMQMFQQYALKLPLKMRDKFYTLEESMYETMLKDVNGKVKSTNAQIQKLKEDLETAEPLAKLLKQGADAAAAIEAGESGQHDDYNPYLDMGQSILGLLAMLKKLPKNSPYAKQIKKTLNAWGMMKSKDPNNPIGKIFGYSLFLAAMTDYANGDDGTEKDIGSVWQELNSLNTEGEPYLQQAKEWIKDNIPESLIKNPTDWKYVNGKVVMTYTNFTKELAGGLGNAATNMSAVEQALDAVSNAVNDQVNDEESEISALEEMINNLNPYIKAFNDGLSFAIQQLSKDPTTNHFLSKALQPMVWQAVQKMIELAEYLIKWGGPAVAKQAQGILNQLQGVANRFPDLGENDLDSLTKIFGQMNSLVGDVKLSDGTPNKTVQASYWRTALGIYKDLGNIGEATHNNDLIIFQKLQDLQGILKRWAAGGKLSQNDLAKFIDDIQALMENGTVLGYGDSINLESFLMEIGGISGSSIYPGGPNDITSLIVLATQYQIITAYVSMYGQDASMKGLQQFTNEYIKEHFPKSSSSELNNILNRVRNISSVVQSPGHHVPFALAILNKSGKMKIEAEALGDAEQNFLSGGTINILGGNWDTILNFLSAATNSFDPQKNGMTTFNQILREIEAEEKYVLKQLEAVESLADEFVRDVVNQYMPEQQALLADLAIVLHFNIDAAGKDQTLLKIIQDFGSAAGTYCFGNLNGSTPAKTAEKILKKEQDAAKNDINNLNKAIQDIDAFITNLELDHEYDGNPSLMEEKGTLIQQLEGYKDDMQTALIQVSKVAKDLDGVTITGDDKGFVANNVPSSLREDEDHVINGDATLQPPGGLSKIYSTIKGDLNDYTSVQVEQEYNVQLIETRVTQMYQLVATCLKTISDSYMQFARGIYK